MILLSADPPLPHPRSWPKFLVYSFLSLAMDGNLRGIVSITPELHLTRATLLQEA